MRDVQISLLWEKLIFYWNSAGWLLPQWLVPFLAIVAFLSLRYALTKLMNNANRSGADEGLTSSNPTPSNFFNVHRASIWAGGLTGLGMVIWISYLSQRGLVFRRSFEFISLLTLIVVVALPIIALWSLHGR